MQTITIDSSFRSDPSDSRTLSPLSSLCALQIPSQLTPFASRFIQFTDRVFSDKCEKDDYLFGCMFFRSVFFLFFSLLLSFRHWQSFRRLRIEIQFSNVRKKLTLTLTSAKTAMSIAKYIYLHFFVLCAVPSRFFPHSVQLANTPYNDS